MNYTNKINIAREFARIRHGDQKYGTHPYIKHLDDVFNVAFDLGMSHDIQVASYLHDLLEDTDTKYAEIKNQFGAYVAEIVFDVTDELGRNREERRKKTYPKILANADAVCLKMCDRIANVEACIESRNYSLLRMYLVEHDDNGFKQISRHPHVLGSPAERRYNSIVAEGVELIPPAP